MKLQLRDYQAVGVSYHLERDVSLNGDDPGLGKTIQAINVWIAMSAELNRPARALIICPATLKINWAREFRTWVPTCRRQILDGRTAPDASRSVHIINYDIVERFRPWIDSVHWDLLVVDEAQYLKNPKALRTKVVLGGRRIRIVKVNRRRVKQVTVWKPISADKRIFMTGTPIVNRPVDLWPLVKAIDRKGLGQSFMKYALRYCNPKKGFRGRWIYTGASNLEELHQNLKRFMIRRRKADVLKELPPKTRQTVFFQSNKLKQLLEKEFTAYDRARYATDEASRMQYIGALSKIRQEVALAKLPSAIERIMEDLECGPLVVFAYHRAVVEGLAEACQGRAVVVYGRTPLKARDLAVRRFQAGEVDLFIGQIKAAGVGLTLTRASQARFVELDWVPGNMIQAEDRLHRIGQRDAVLIQHYILEGSLDERMVKKLIRKQEIIEAAVDGRISKDRIVDH